MIRTSFAGIAFLIASTALAPAAGGGAAGAAGAHASGAAQSGSSFGKPAVGNNPFPGVTARPGCIGGFAGASATGAPSPMAPPGLINPSPTNGSAVKGPLQSNPDLPRLTQQDQRLIGELKRANDKLGEVGKTSKTRPESQQPGQSGSVTGENAAPPPPPMRPATDSSSAVAAKESTDRGSLQGKPDVLRMSEQDQRLAREIIRDTQNLAKVGNPGAARGTLPPQGSPTAPSGDLRRDTNGPHRPTNTMGAAAGAAC